MLTRIAHYDEFFFRNGRIWVADARMQRLRAQACAVTGSNNWIVGVAGAGQRRMSMVSSIRP